MDSNKPKTIKREGYTYREAKNVAEAAILITQEANDAGCIEWCALSMKYPLRGAPIGPRHMR